VSWLPERVQKIAAENEAGDIETAVFARLLDGKALVIVNMAGQD
jgi:hypothetical protein